MRMVNMSPKRARLRSRNGPVRVVQARVWTARGMDGPGGRPVAAGLGAAVVAGAPTVVALMRGPPRAWERWAREEASGWRGAATAGGRAATAPARPDGGDRLDDVLQRGQARLPPGPGARRGKRGGPPASRPGGV